MMRANKERPTSLQYFRSSQSNISKADEVEVQHFFERDDNSRATTGKKETITRNKVKMQKRLLSDSMKDLHKKFRIEYPAIKISYTAFCRRRPFWVVKPSIQDRETCLCKLHANLQFMADRLFQQSVIKSSRIYELIESLCCETPTKECMYRECLLCKGKDLETSPFERGDQTWWFEWRSKAEEREKKTKDGTMNKFTVHLTVKEKVYGTL